MEEIITADQIPDDPLAMPPPYWRGSGAIFHVLDALESLINLLPELVIVLERTNEQLDDFYIQHPKGDDELEEFSEICEDLWKIEHKVKMKAELVIFMSAIQAEDKINQFCVFNLHKDVAETIEKLSPAEKLTIASSIVSKMSVKGKAAFSSIKGLSSWRNAFAHGHCVDRPDKSLRHNHLINPKEYPGVPDTITKMKELVDAFIKVSQHLKSISLNPYTGGNSYEEEQILEYLKEISRYQFKLIGDSNDVYEIILKPN